jgi:hypothetical protein
MDYATPPVPLTGGEVHEETPNWVFRVDPILALASLLPKTNELRLTIGLVTGLAHTAELGGYVNFLNTKLI